MRRTVALLVVMIIGFTAFPIQKAEAIDPVTIAILAPIALKAASIAAPYVLRGLKSGGIHMLKMGKDILEILLLPWGIIQVTMLWTFNQIGPGFKNIVVGGIAPFKLALDAILLPVAFCGFSMNSG